MPLPTPKRRESYTDYVSRVHRHVKRNKNAVRGIYQGRGKNRKLHMPSVTKKISVAWRKHKRSMKK